MEAALGVCVEDGLWEMRMEMKNYDKSAWKCVRIVEKCILQQE